MNHNRIPLLERSVLDYWEERGWVGLPLILLGPIPRLPLLQWFESFLTHQYINRGTSESRIRPLMKQSGGLDMNYGDGISILSVICKTRGAGVEACKPWIKYSCA